MAAGGGEVEDGSSRPRPMRSSRPSRGGGTPAGLGPVALAVCLVLLVGCAPRRGDGVSATPDTVSREATAARPAPLDCPADLESTALEGEAAWHERPVVALRKRAWEESLGGKEAARPHVRARLRAWPTPVLVEPSDLPTGDRPLLERIARDTWRGLDGLTDRENGLPVDHVRIGTGEVGDYTNVTSVGLLLVDIVAARELGFLSVDQARARIAQVLETLGRLETHDGYFYNFYDTTSLERTSNFLSFVDLSWLSAGLMVVRQAVPELAAPATALLERLDLGFFYDRSRGQMSHGYYVSRGTPSPYHYGVLFTEARLGVLLAIGRGEAPEAAWYRMARIFSPSCPGQRIEPREARLVTVRGHELWTGWYEWEGLRFVPSWGGSMFEALMPSVVLDEPRLAPRGLGPNARVHALVQQRYAEKILGDPVWGLSPSSMPDGRSYREYGVPVLGLRGYRPGAITPHATALALAVRPGPAIDGLRRLIDSYPVYGDFGFYDAVDPKTGEVARTYLALDQSMLFLAIANHLTEGAIQRHFAADPVVGRILPLLAEEAWFD